MTQPTTQVQLDTGHEFYGWFWYAQGVGLYDARNNAMLTKTGSAGMSTEGGANVVRGDGTTSYTLGENITLPRPFTISWRSRVDVGSASKGMAFGDNTATNNFVWMKASDNTLSLRSNGGGPSASTADVTEMHTWTITYQDTVPDALTIYRDGVSVATIPSTTASPFILKAILNGYTGTTYAAIGSLEFLHVMPICATPTQVTSLVADPYQALQAAGGTDGTGTATPASITLTAPAGSASGTGGANATGTGSLQSVILTAPAGSATGTTSGAGTITTPVMKNNAGTVLASETGVTVNVYNASTGALIVQKTGQTSNASGIVTISDALIVPATTYAYEVVLTGARRRLPTASAA